MKNQIKTVLLLTTLSALFLGIGYAIGGQTGVIYALTMSLVMNFGAYWFSTHPPVEERVKRLLVLKGSR